jgi:Tfp pilus assembly protein PilF
MDRIAKLKEFLSKEPEDNFVQHALAMEYIKIGQDGEARNLLESLLGRDPSYTGSYYHLGKLLERQGETGLASSWFHQGMEKAKAAGDLHALSELQGAFDALNEVS